MRLGRNATAALFLLPLLACQLVDPLSDITGGDAASDAATDSGGDASIDDAGNADTGTNDDAGPCPGTGGPTAVRVGPPGATFCIDSTEVTNRQYKIFLTSVDAGAFPQPAYCAWNTTFGSAAAYPADDLPAADLDWCDAYSFCAWAGKRLCGKIGGGALAYASIGDPSASQLLAACAHAPDGGFEQFPYGATFDPTACNGIEKSDGGSTLPVASEPGCEGGYPRLFDLAGNVEEWSDACDNATGDLDCCPTFGGGYKEDMVGCGLGIAPPAGCTSRTRHDTHSDVGFRCCSD